MYSIYDLHPPPPMNSWLISPRFVRIHKLSISIFLFLVIMFLVHWMKPGCVYDERGQFRPFGIGYQKCTVFPMWVVSIISAIMAYLLVIWYIM